MLDLFTVFAAACDPSKTWFGLPVWYRYLDMETVLQGPPGSTVERCQLAGGFSFPGDLALVALALLEIVLRLAGLVAIALVIYGGIQFVTSQGDPEAAKHARQTIINAAIGLLIALFATTLVAFVGTRLV